VLVHRVRCLWHVGVTDLWWPGERVRVIHLWLLAVERVRFGSVIGHDDRLLGDEVVALGESRAGMLVCAWDYCRANVAKEVIPTDDVFGVYSTSVSSLTNWVPKSTSA